MSVEEKFYMMWLSRSLGMSMKKTKLLLDKFGSPEGVWNASEKSIKNVIKDSKVFSMLEDGKEKITDWIVELRKLEIKYISINDKNYPYLLKEIHDPPVGIYVQGNLPDAESSTYISIIGARRCSEYGKNMAYKFSKELALDNFTIVSGLAKGIDSISHVGALEAGGKTVAVLGFGHKHCYPSENRKLMKTIGERGCLLSEYPPETQSNRFNFVQRNRIIAGLSKGLLVVEAGRKSGTMTTVDFANESGRTIMALPSNITSSSGEGTNDLIREGCPMITKIEDIYFELGIDKNEKGTENEVPFELETDEKKVYDILSYEAVGFDYIVGLVKMPVADVQYILTMLELKGIIQKLNGERYIKSL